jgi:hypothetical protein
LTFDFINRTSHACLAGGYPHVVVSQPGHRALVATPGGFFDQRIPPADLLPGAHAQFDVGFSYACLTSPAPPLYQHVTVSLSSGGTFSQALSGGQLPNSQIPAGIQVGCGVTVTELYVPPPQVTYPPDPMVGLTARLLLPSSVHIGQTLVYVVSLVNPTASPVALNPCRGYYQLLDSLKSPSSFYQLNCGAAGPIPADGSESFVMNMPSFDVKPGAHLLCWTMTAAAAIGPNACGSITFSP